MPESIVSKDAEITPRRAGLAPVMLRYRAILFSFPVEPLEVAAGLVAILRGMRLAIVPTTPEPVAQYLDHLISINVWGGALVVLGVLQVVAVGINHCPLRKGLPFAVLFVASVVVGGYVLFGDAVNGLHLYASTFVLQVWIGMRVGNAANLMLHTPMRSNGH